VRSPQLGQRSSSSGLGTSAISHPGKGPQHVRIVDAFFTSAAHQLRSLGARLSVLLNVDERESSPGGLGGRHLGRPRAPATSFWDGGNQLDGDYTGHCSLLRGPTQT
jgi:hypothetical protein